MPEKSQEKMQVKADQNQQLKNHNPNQQHNSKKQPLAPIPNNRREPDAERQSTGPQRSQKRKSEWPDAPDP